MTWPPLTDEMMSTQQPWNSGAAVTHLVLVTPRRRENEPVNILISSAGKYSPG